MSGDFAMHGDIPLRVVARRALEFGRIPAVKTSGTWGGFGSGAACSVCSIAIAPEQLEMEVEFSHQPGRSYHLHVACFHAWESECGSLAGDGARMNP
jgi:hypothetical protein